MPDTIKKIEVPDLAKKILQKSNPVKASVGDSSIKSIRNPELGEDEMTFMDDIDLMTKLGGYENVTIEKVSNLSKEEMSTFLEYINKNNLPINGLTANYLDNLSYSELQSLRNTLNESLKGISESGGDTALIQQMKMLDEYCFYGSKNPNSELKSMQRKAITDFAKSQLGVKYNKGDNPDGSGGLWDNDKANEQLSCNGLVYHAYQTIGIEIPQGSVGQISEAPIVTSTGKVADMSPGDIIVYDNEGLRSDINYTPWSFRHVALYTGNGKMIESTYRDNGNINGVREMPINDGEYSYSVSW